jgi:transcriptional regulator with XRE-family HTH domain
MYPNLKIAIFKTGIHQNRISKMLGINEANLSKIIHGYREPSEAQRRMLATYLEMDETWLFERFEVGLPSRTPRNSQAQQEPKDHELNSENS